MKDDEVIGDCYESYTGTCKHVLNVASDTLGLQVTFGSNLTVSYSVRPAETVQDIEDSTMTRHEVDSCL